jgi:putative transposase
MRTYRFRLYPNKAQEILINKTFGCVRYIYNHFLNDRTNLYQNFNMRKTAFECCADIKVLTKEYDWLKEVDSCALRCAVFNLDDAFKRFFSKKGNYPKFKSKYGRASYRTNNMINNYKGKEYNSIKIDLINKELTLPKLKCVKFRGYRNLKEIGGRIINATITKENNRFYASILIDTPFKCKETQGNDVVALDMGVKNMITTSNNEVYENKKVTDKYAKRLALLQRALTRKTKGSQNYKKCLAKINSIYRKIKNTRKYYLHEISKKLTDTYKVIITETLKVKDMIESSKTKLSKAIQDISIYEFFRQLEYKAKNKKVHLYKVDQYYASSQICACCGSKNEEMKNLNKREFSCKECGNKLDRDYNASLNILNKGLEIHINSIAKIVINN